MGAAVKELGCGYGAEMGMAAAAVVTVGGSPVPCEELGQLERRLQEQRRRLHAEREALLARRRSRSSGGGRAATAATVAAATAAIATDDLGECAPEAMAEAAAAFVATAVATSAAVQSTLTAIARAANEEMTEVEVAELAAAAHASPSPPPSPMPSPPPSPPPEQRRQRWDGGRIDTRAARERRLQRARQMVNRAAPGPPVVQGELVAQSLRVNRLGRARDCAAEHEMAV